MSQTSTAKKRILKPSSASSNQSASSNKNTPQYALNNLLLTLAQVQSNIRHGIHDSIEIDTSIVNPSYEIDNELAMAASLSWEV